MSPCSPAPRAPQPITWPPAGADTAAGLTPATPWLTVAKVNKTPFAPGDSILFKRGDAWREGEALYALSNGAEGKPVLFGAYGNGPKPLILASKDISAARFWTRSHGNIWKTTAPVNLTEPDLRRTGRITPDVANLIFNNEALAGVKKRFVTNLTAQGDFCLNLEDTLLYLYSAESPAAFYTKIEAGGIRNCENNIEVINGRHLAFVDLDIRYSKNNGLFLNNCSHVTISNCSFSWIGGCYFPIQTFMRSPRPNPVRMGNGVQLWKGNSDITVSHCTMDQVYDAGISPQGTDSGYAIKNLRFHHNLIQNCFYSFEFWGRPASSTGQNIYFENNTCLNSGSGWSTPQRPDKGGAAHLKFFESDMVFSNVFIRNNIFYQSVNACLYSQHERAGFNTGAMWAAFVLDHNCYFQPAMDRPVVKWRGGAANGGGDFFMDGLRAYQNQSAKDLHSLFADPKLAPGFAPGPGSPALERGMDLGYPYAGASPNIGAF